MLITWIAATTLLLSAQQAQVQPGQLGKIAGRVIHAKTGEPVRKAVIQLAPTGNQSAPPRSVSASPEGTYHFENVQPGTYQLTASRTGFLNQRYGAGAGRTTSGSVLTISAGKEATGIDFRLVPHGVIAGRIVDRDGDPVQFANITIYRATVVAGRRSMVNTSSATTNDIGEFRAAGLRPGKYFVSASSSRRGFGPGGGPGFGPSSQRAVEDATDAFVPTFYPGSVDPAGATIIDLQPGQEQTGLVMELRRSPIFKVRGVIQGVSATAARLNIMLATGGETDENSSSPPRNASVFRDGKFEVAGVPPGVYTLIAIRAERRPVLVARVPVTVGNGDVEVAVPVQEPVSLSGVVRMEGNAPIRAESLRVYLESASSTPFGQPETAVKKDGAFSFSAVSRDRLILRFSNLPDTAYVKSLRLGNQDILETGLDLRSSGPSAALDVLLANNAGSVSGAVKTEAKTGVAFTVSLHPDPPRPARPDLVRTATTGGDGTFRIKGVPPGDYKLLAWEDFSTELAQDTELLKQFESSAVKVVVREGSSEQAEITPVKIPENQ